MAILIMLGNAAIGGAWIIAHRAARRRAMQTATGRRLADVIAGGSLRNTTLRHCHRMRLQT